VVPRIVPLLCAVTACSAVVAAVCAAAPPAALAKAGDAAATRAYVRANYALVRVARANLRAGEAGLKGLVRQITGECPLAAAMVAFAHAVGGLHWSNRRLTRIVRTYATQLEGLARLALPNVCADVKAWAASGYRTLPASTVQFDRVYNADDIEAEEVPLRLLTPFESARDASLVRRTKRLEAPLAEAEAHAVADYTRILDALKLNQ
jgi:hypothetical protein